MFTTKVRKERSKRQTEGTTASDRYLIFTLAGDQFAVEVPRLLQIRSWGSVIPTPDTPDYVLGVTDLQGASLPIVDLRKRLALQCIPPTSRTLVVVLRFVCNGVTLQAGFTVDSSSGAHKLVNKVTELSPDQHSPVSRDFVRGISWVNDQRVILLETDRLIDRSVLAGEATTRLPDSRHIH